MIWLGCSGGSSGRLRGRPATAGGHAAAGGVEQLKHPDASPAVGGRLAPVLDADGELGDHGPQRLGLWQRRGHHVTDPVRHQGLPPLPLGEVSELGPRLVDASRCAGFVSSHMSILSEPPMMMVRIFTGLSQLRWTWAMEPSLICTVT